MSRTKHRGENGKIYPLRDDLVFDCNYTGSKGNNCYLVETDGISVMFDLGVPFTKAKSKVREYKTKHVFYTHEHGDHLKSPSLNQLLRFNPYVKIYMLESVYTKHIESKEGKPIPEDNLQLIKHGDTLEIDGWTVVVRNAPHSVPCVGFIFIKDGYNVTYVTDTRSFMYFETLNGEVMEYDVMLKESNHDEDKLNNRIKWHEDKILSQPFKKDNYGHRSQIVRLMGSTAHASTRVSTKFEINHGKEECVIVDLHGSDSLLN